MSMRIAAAWIVLGAAGCGTAVDLETSRKFQAAEQVYQQASTPEGFLTAAGLYQEILDSGCVSGTVLYNQGNAFMRAGKRGRAIAAYRRAKRFRPRDPLLAGNLLSALNTSDSIQREKSVLENILFWQEWISYREKFLLTTAAVAGTLLAALATQFTRRKKTFVQLAMAGVAVTLIIGFSTAYDWYRFEKTKQGVVIVEETTARKGNSNSYEPAFTQALAEGTEFIVLETRDNWLRVRLPGAGEGWIETRTAVVY